MSKSQNLLLGLMNVACVVVFHNPISWVLNLPVAIWFFYDFWKAEK